MNIITKMDNLKISDETIDSDGAICYIINLTPTSVEVAISKKAPEGVNCKQWFEIGKFHKRFTVKSVVVLNKIKFSTNDKNEEQGNG